MNMFSPAESERAGVCSHHRTLGGDGVLGVGGWGVDCEHTVRLDKVIGGGVTSKSSEASWSVCVCVFFTST